MQDAIEQDRAAGRLRPWEELAGEVLHDRAVPHPWPELLQVLAAFEDLGTDANGGVLGSEIRAELEERGVVDSGEREAWRRLFRACDGARRRAMRQLFEIERERVTQGT